MSLKIFRIFYGGYLPDYNLLNQRGFIIIKLPLPIITPISVDQGFGQIKGQTQKTGEEYSFVSVCLFRRDNRVLLWETKSNRDGFYLFRNIKVGLECFIVAFDPNNQYNAVIQDNVVPK